MTRWLLPILAGLVMGVAGHLASILMLPYQAPTDAWARLAALAPINQMIVLPASTPGTEVLPLVDPAFVHAVCRFDLSGGAMKVRAPLTADYTSISFYTRNGAAFYGINDRAAGSRIIDVDLMTRAQHELLPQDDEITAADRLIVDAPTAQGIAVVRALVREPGTRASIEDQLARSGCGRAG